MTKSFIALVAAVGVAFAATSAMAEGDGWDPFPPKDDGKRNLTRFKPGVCNSDRTWKKCVFLGLETGPMHDLGTKANRPAWKPSPSQDWRSKAFRADGE